MATVSDYKNDVAAVKRVLHLFREAKTLLGRGAPYSHDENGEIKATLDAAGKEIKPFPRRLKLLSDSGGRMKIVFAGRMNVGKSTLVNAVLGKAFAVSSTANAACTATAVEYSYGENFSMEIYPDVKAGTLKTKSKTFGSRDELKAALKKEISHDNGSEGKSRCRKVVVRVPAPVLRAGTTLVDLPGLGAAGKKGEADDEIVDSYLEREIYSLFWLVSQNNGFLEEDESNLDSAHVKILVPEIFVIKIVDWKKDDSDREQKEKRIFSFGENSRFLPPSSHFLYGKGENDDYATEVIKRIEELGNPREDIKRILEGFADRIQEWREKNDDRIFPPTALSECISAFRNCGWSGKFPAFLENEKNY